MVRAQYTAICQNCSKTFHPFTRSNRFCSNACSQRFRADHRVPKPPKQPNATCEQCGDPFVMLDKQSRFCSHACYSVSLRSDPQVGFWQYVDRSGGPAACWPWLGGLTTKGYGKYRHQNAHRVAWILTHGPLPEDIFVCHDCPGGDNKACVNPAHMFLGDTLDNMRDLAQKGGHAHGERHGCAQLTEAQVREIRARHAVGGIRQQDLATEYGVSQAAISSIIRRQSWAHVA